MTVYKSGYTSGNYEAFARPRKPPGVDDKTAWFVGSGIASLAGAVFLIRDGHMKGEKITILEQCHLVGGALDGYQEEDGFVIRGGRELEDHYECLWDLFRSIPSLETEGASVLDEFYWLDKDDPNYSLCRITENQGHNAAPDGKFHLSKESHKNIQDMFLATNKEMSDVRIDEVFCEDFFESNFWIYWQTMFGYEKWHSALEMKRESRIFVLMSQKLTGSLLPQVYPSHQG
jgi:oleate hydratase